MKRLFKFLSNLILALIAVFITFAIIFFVTPSWQRALAERVMTLDTARQWQVDGIHIQPTGVEAHGVFVLDGPVGAEMEYLQLSGPIWQALLTGVLEIESGTIRGLEVDLTQVKVGDLTSEDYQLFLKRVSEDMDFWKERVGLAMSKFAANGLDVHLRNTQVSGKLVMPGDKLVPINWLIVEANSNAPRLIEMQPHGILGKAL